MSPPFNDRFLRAHLTRNGFEDIDMRACLLDDGLTVPLVAFSHRPCDTRTACVAAISTTENLTQDLLTTRKTGAPLVFVRSPEREQWDVWFHKGETPQKLWPHERGSLDAFFTAYKDQITPESIFRAKTLGRLDTQQQLTFVDAGTLEMVEAEAGEQLCRLIERMMHITATNLGLGSLRELDEKNAQWLVKANFWLLAARLLQDKKVPNFIRLDLADIDTTFARVTRHYGAAEQTISTIRRNALRHAGAELQRHGSLALVSTETLAHVYENALITPQTRKALGTHSTPSWLVDYIFSRLSPWIEAMPADQRHVYEPTCGHAPFLLGALRLLSAGKPCIKLSDAERHEWLVQRLRGSEIDDFAREVARLSLTLADIPNPNGWVLDSGDLFQGDQLEARIAEADIVVANPPFEAKSIADIPDEDLSPISRAAELLRRITRAARPGTLVGLIVPQTLLDSPKVVSLRATLLKEFEWLEILRLPDKDVFKKADVESAVLIGRRFPDKSTRRKPVKTTFNNVAENDVPHFAKTGTATIHQTRSFASLENGADHLMLLPDLADVWESLRNVGSLNDIAEVGQGFSFKAETDESFPEDETQVSETRRAGYAPGFHVFPKALPTHLLPPTVWLNRNKNAISRPRSGYVQAQPQIVLNYARVSRGPWRIAAYLDEKGHPATSRFLTVRPRNSRYSLRFLWAVLNSPIANAFSKSFTSKRDILAETMRAMPLATPTDAHLQEIEEAVRAYRLACLRPTTRGSRPKTATRAGAIDTATPDLPGLYDPHVSEAEDEANLRELHWRMDAAVIRLYGLDPALERQLLDYFSGHLRERVPFVQTEYLPKAFTEIQTVDQLLAVTADWPIHNERRSLLIDKECAGSTSREERAELKRLQKQASLRRQLFAPYPIAALEAEVERLKREGKWE